MPECVVERLLDDDGLDHRAEVEQGALTARDGDRLAVGGVASVVELGLVDDEPMVTSPAKSRARDLEVLGRPAGDSPEPCRRTVRGATPRPSSPDRCEELTLPM